MKMNRQSLSALGLTASLLLSGCTVDAQLASQLLSSLQTAAKSSKTVTGSASVSASLSSGAATANDNVIEISPDQQVMTRALQIACGGPGMKIASVDESETEDTESSSESTTTESSTESTASDSNSTEATQSTSSDANSTEATQTTSSDANSTETTQTTSSDTTETTTTEQTLSDADTVQPVVIAPPDPTAAPGQPASRARQIKLNANLQFELRQMGRMKGSERNRRFSEIQQHYPEMRNTAPVPVRVRGQAARQAPSVQIIFVQMPGMPYGGQMEPHHGEMNFRPMPAQGRVQMPAGRQPAKGPAFGQAGNIGVSGRALLEGLGNLPCQAPQNDGSTDTTSDTTTASDTSSN